MGRAKSKNGQRRPRRKFTPEFKADVVRMCRTGSEPRAIMGMMADEPELMDRACELAMQARKQSRMRPVDG